MPLLLRGHWGTCGAEGTSVGRLDQETTKRRSQMRPTSGTEGRPGSCLGFKLKA